MKIGDITKNYDEAYAFVSVNKGTKIKPLGNKQYQIAEIPQPTLAEQNEAIRARRESLYVMTSDKLKADYDEAVARGADNVEELKQIWLESKDKVRAENPYLDIVD